MSKLKIVDRRSEVSIMSERNLLSTLHHSFIVNMYFAFQDFYNLYLVMDLLTGGDLRYHIAHKRTFSERETKFFISNMILALEYIHSKNIIHRDIKPENLVLENNGYLRITDFGVAKINEKDNSSETSGTPGYMAPEVLLVLNHSFPSDFFALGVIGYEFMLGYRPYLGRSRKEIKDLIINQQAKIHTDEIPDDWSIDVKDFVNRLLMRKPKLRLGYNGIDELKKHPWMKDIDWEKLANKKIKPPFVPDNKENFDKKYCEGEDDISEDTLERYQIYAQSDMFPDVFVNYTFCNLSYISNYHIKRLKKFKESNVDIKEIIKQKVEEDNKLLDLEKKEEKSNENNDNNEKNSNRKKTDSILIEVNDNNENNEKNENKENEENNENNENNEKNENKENEENKENNENNENKENEENKENNKNNNNEQKSDVKSTVDNNKQNNSNPNTVSISNKKSKNEFSDNVNNSTSNANKENNNNLVQVKVNNLNNNYNSNKSNSNYLTINSNKSKNNTNKKIIQNKSKYYKKDKIKNLDNAKSIKENIVYNNYINLHFNNYVNNKNNIGNNNKNLLNSIVQKKNRNILSNQKPNVAQRFAKKSSISKSSSMKIINTNKNLLENIMVFSNNNDTTLKYHLNKRKKLLDNKQMSTNNKKNRSTSIKSTSNKKKSNENIKTPHRICNKNDSMNSNKNQFVLWKNSKNINKENTQKNFKTYSGNRIGKCHSTDEFIEINYRKKYSNSNDKISKSSRKLINTNNISNFDKNINTRLNYYTINVNTTKRSRFSKLKNDKKVENKKDNKNSYNIFNLYSIKNFCYNGKSVNNCNIKTLSTMRKKKEKKHFEFGTRKFVNKEKKSSSCNNKRNENKTRKKYNFEFFQSC